MKLITWVVASIFLPHILILLHTLWIKGNLKIGLFQHMFLPSHCHPATALTFTHFTFTEIFFKSRYADISTFYLCYHNEKHMAQIAEWLLIIWLHWCFLILHFLFFSWLNCWYRQKTHILCDLKLDLENILSRYRCLKMEVWTTGWLRKIRLTSLSW